MSYSNAWQRARPAHPGMLTDKQSSIMKTEVTMILKEGHVGEHGQGCGPGIDKCLNEIEIVRDGE